MSTNRSTRWWLAATLAASGWFSACTASELKEPPAQKPSAYRTQVLADSPAGYWRLDEPLGTVVFDQTTFNNRGKISKGVTLGYQDAATGDGDLAMTFDGVDGEVTVPDSKSLRMLSGTVTIEAWVRPAALQSGEVWLVVKGTAGVQTEYGLVLMDGVPGYQGIAELYTAKAEPLTPGAWSHVVATVALNKDVRLYINGKEAGAYAIATKHAVTAAMQPVMFGNEAASMGQLVGALDDLAIYPVALTAEQIAKHFSLAKQGR